MSCYDDFVSEAHEELIRLIDQGNDVVIIGDNASGKSDLIRMLAVGRIEDCYYIDVVNRSFVVGKVSENIISDVESVINVDMINKRLDDEHFNREDYFALHDRIERWFSIYQDELVEITKDFFRNDFYFDKDLDERGVYKAYVAGKEWRLSSGYQAFLRIVAELIVCRMYYKETDLIVVIDELDQFLSVGNASRIFDFIRGCFNNYQFVITTHSSDLIVNSKDFKLLSLEGTKYMVYDGDDFDTLTSVNVLFDELYFKENDRGKKNSLDTRLDDVLDSLLNHRISGSWNQKDENALEALKSEKMTGVQKIIYMQIKDWDV